MSTVSSTMPVTTAPDWNAPPGRSLPATSNQAARTTSTGVRAVTATVRTGRRSTGTLNAGAASRTVDTAASAATARTTISSMVS